MGKIIFWLVVVFAVLLVLRIINVSKARARREASGHDARAPQATATVRCVGCGVFLPRAEARALPDGFHCGRAECARPRGPR